SRPPGHIGRCHMQAVTQWSGREAKALRLARRMTTRTFATHLGVSDRMVSKWESAGDALRPGVTNQIALDASLATAPPEARARFYQLAGDRVARVEALSLVGEARIRRGTPSTANSWCSSTRGRTCCRTA